MMRGRPSEHAVDEIPREHAYLYRQLSTQPMAMMRRDDEASILEV
jgi:hypothetical protein